MERDILNQYQNMHAIIYITKKTICMSQSMISNAFLTIYLMYNKTQNKHGC